MNFRDTIGYGREDIPAMDATPGVNDSLIELCKAILERLGATPADPDDSLHTIIGQRDDAAIAMDTASDGTDTIIEMLRATLERIGETAADPDDSILTNVGQRDDTTPAMNAAQNDTDSLTERIKAIEERLGVTPADADDSVHTIVGQRDGTQSAGIIKGTDTMVAMLKQIITQQGLVYFGDVTTYTDLNTFASTNLITYENDYFKNWYVYCVRDDGGASAAPQNEYRLITDYVSATGTFTHNAFSAIMAEGDQVLILHPAIYEIMSIRGGAYTIQDVMEEHQAGLDLAEYGTSSIVCDGNEQTLYEVTGSDFTFFFAGGYIDFTGSNAGAGEDTTIKMYHKTDGTNYREVFAETFLQAAVPAPVSVPFPRSSNTQIVPDTLYSKQDVKITITQAAVGGGWNTLDYRIVDSQRGG